MTTIDLMNWLLLLLAPVVFVWLWFRPAPYGRHSDGGWGPEMPGRLAWVLIEWPTLIVFGGFALVHQAWVPAGLWMLHYVRRTVVFPLVQPSFKDSALVVVVSGMVFQLANSTTNGAALAASRSWDDPLLWAGVTVFLVGQAVNIHGDRVIMGLRAPGETGYRLPEAGLFRWVTNVAYLGEILTWCGWAVLTGSLAGLAFAVFTIANLAPRARSNALWYVKRFGRAPGRWVLVPGLW